MTRQTTKERRCEQRTPATGEVHIFLEAPDEVEICGQLSDYSKHGFRASHHHAAVCAGQIVRFRHPFGQGSARVVWNRILPGHVESGFLILD